MICCYSQCSVDCGLDCHNVSYNNQGIKENKMKKLSQKLSLFFVVGLLFASSSSFAIPTLKYGGSISYTTSIFSPADLNITGKLLSGHTDLSYSPDLATSSVILSADFLSASSDGLYTTGLFGTTPVNDCLFLMLMA